MVKELIKQGLYIKSKDYMICSKKTQIFRNNIPKIITEKVMIKMLNLSLMFEKLFNLPNLLSELIEHINGLMKQMMDQYRV